MNELARLWAQKRLRELEDAELRKLACDIRMLNAEMEPIRKQADATRKRNMRQDGATGFVMVNP